LGADGCVFVGDPSKKLIEVRIFNQDGSEAPLSGNGVRCAAACLHHQGVINPDQTSISFQTLDGIKEYELLQGREPTWRYLSRLGKPGLDPEDVPFIPGPGYSITRGERVELDQRDWVVHPLWIGNPQTAVFVDYLPDDGELKRLGPEFGKLDHFPEGTNVSFVRVDGSDEVTIKIWERGVGPTWSSGTGSSGAAVASILTGRVHSPVTVKTSTGIQEVSWKSGGEIRLTGDARFVASVAFFWPQPEAD
jgi:diaminopimelate epimerase